MADWSCSSGSGPRGGIFTEECGGRDNARRMCGGAYAIPVCVRAVAMDRDEGN